MPGPLYYQEKKDWQGRNIPVYHSAVECDETAQKENGTPRHPETVQVLINTQKPSLQFLAL